jgi:hypothetical protein
VSEDWISADQLEKGSVYELKSRNLIAGVYDGDRGFIGIREKFGDEYLFTEYLAVPESGVHGTARAVRKIGKVRGNPLTEHYGLKCQTCGKGSWRDEGGSWPTNEHCAGGCSDEDRSVAWTTNQLLFDVLEAMEQPIRQRLAEEFPKITPPWRDTEKKEGTDEH